MSCNTGKIDRILRVLAGIALIVWAIMSGNIIGYIGVILIVTAAVGFCPLYKVLGINTGCDVKHSE
ncbi:MAG: DUF2892 domain-containing protein [Sulfuricurvum sp.]|nr:DUF2892 domain-containing protein [Sulfuricurvum sp.]